MIQEACYFEFQCSVQCSVKKWSTSTTHAKYKKGQGRAEIVKVISTHNWCSFLFQFLWLLESNKSPAIFIIKQPWNRQTYYFVNMNDTLCNWHVFCLTTRLSTISCSFNKTECFTVGSFLCSVLISEPSMNVLLSTYTFEKDYILF